MHTYPKDASYDRWHGDQRCPANDSDFKKRPKGLFFSPNVQKGSMGLPHPGSIYGDTRLELQIPTLLQPGSVKFYFSDFYCIQGKGHHVCIFATNPHSRTPNVKGFHNLDAWCRKKLPPINVVDVDRDSLRSFLENLDVITSLVRAILNNNTLLVVMSSESVERLLPMLHQQVENLQTFLNNDWFTPDGDVIKVFTEKVRQCGEVIAPQNILGHNCATREYLFLFRVCTFFIFNVSTPSLLGFPL